MSKNYVTQVSQHAVQVRQAFLDGGNWAYTAGIIAVVVGGFVVFTLVPKHQDEKAAVGEVRERGRRARETWINRTFGCIWSTRIGDCDLP